MPNRILHHRLHQQLGHHQLRGARVHIQLHMQPSLVLGVKEHQVLVKVLHLLGDGHCGLAVGHAVAHHLAERDDDPVGLLRVAVEDFRLQQLQRIEEEVRVDLRLQRGQLKAAQLQTRAVIPQHQLVDVRQQIVEPFADALQLLILPAHGNRLDRIDVHARERIQQRRHGPLDGAGIHHRHDQIEQQADEQRWNLHQAERRGMRLDGPDRDAEDQLPV